MKDEKYTSLGKIKTWFKIQWRKGSIGTFEEYSSECKASAYNAGDPGSIPGSERFPGEGNGNSLKYSCLENQMDGETW